MEQSAWVLGFGAICKMEPLRDDLSLLLHACFGTCMYFIHVCLYVCRGVYVCLHTHTHTEQQLLHMRCLYARMQAFEHTCGNLLRVY